LEAVALTHASTLETETAKLRLAEVETVRFLTFDKLVVRLRFELVALAQVNALETVVVRLRLEEISLA